MKRIIFLRHGETNKNRAHRLHAVEDKSRLNEVGKKFNGSHHSCYILTLRNTFSSTELRAVENDRIGSNILKIPIIQDTLLHERVRGFRLVNLGLE